MEYRTDIEALLKKLDEKPVDPERLVSENADENTAALFGYLVRAAQLSK